MAQMKDGGPAFPGDKYMKNGDGWGTYAHGGMSLRDYHAAHAPIGIAEMESVLGRAVDLSNEQACAVVFMLLAKTRLLYADAMLAAREATPCPNA